jgi:histidinol phosphatase-like PHP family hydrolase
VDLERIFEVALEEGVALEVNGLPVSICAASRSATPSRAGVPIVCSTDAHLVWGPANMTFSVATARGPRSADVVNTRRLEELGISPLRGKRLA